MRALEALTVAGAELSVCSGDPAAKEGRGPGTESAS